MAEVTPEEVLMADQAMLATRAGRFVTMMGGVASLALTIGIAVWGYKMLVRDVSGVPIVAAIEGPMRVAPENPGGELALHTGLAVNAVAAEGGAAGPEDRLILAPNAVDVTSEDIEIAPNAKTNEVYTSIEDAVALAVEGTQVSFEPADANAPLTPEQILALADQIAADVNNSNVIEATNIAVAEAALPQAQAISASVPGISRSLRPQLRPEAGLVQRVAATATPTPSTLTGQPVSILTDDMAAGTKLAQLGAFDSPELANSEWQRLSTRFNAFLEGHQPLIQEATSGGRTFYRLRVSGFSDLSDARRFCSALMAENAACIPVVVR